MPHELSTSIRSVCFTCRKQFSRYCDATWICPDCGGDLVRAGKFLKTPKRTDKKGWRKLEILLLEKGVTLDYYVSFDDDGNGPGMLRRIPTEMKEILAYPDPRQRAEAQKASNAKLDRYNEVRKSRWRHEDRLSSRQIHSRQPER